jgi:glycerol transport system permease protein
MLQTSAVKQFEYGKAGAYGILYFFIILVISYIFYLVLTRMGSGKEEY